MSNASPTCLNFSSIAFCSASALSTFLSGWYFKAHTLYAALISMSEAVRCSPMTW